MKALTFDDVGQTVLRVEFFSPLELYGPAALVKAADPEDDYPRKPSL